MRQGASRTAAYHRQLTSRRWPDPSVAAWVPSASLLLRGPGGCSPRRRRLPAGASSRSRALGRRRRGRHGQQARHGVGRRCPAGGVHPSGFGVRDPAVQPSAVRSPGLVVVRRVRRSAVCCPPVRVQPSDVQPSVRTRPSPPMLRRWRWGSGRAGRATLTTGTGGGPGGCRAVDGSTTVEEAGTPATLPKSRRSVGGRWRTRAGRVGCGPRRPRLPAERPGRPGRREVSAPAAWLASSGWGARPRWVVVAEPDGRVGGPGGATGGVGGDGRAAPARPKPAASAPGSLPAVL
jgi:hypothetical protein